MKAFHVIPPRILIDDDLGIFVKRPLLIEYEFLIRYPRLERIFKVRKNWILDCSPNYRTDDFDLDRYAFLVRTLQPEFAVLPDVLGDTEATLSLYYQICQKLSNDSEYIVPVQGKTYRAASHCLNVSLQPIYSAGLERYRFGIPYRFVEKGLARDRELARVGLLRDLRRVYNGPLHLMGLWDPFVLRDERCMTEQDSLDSSFAFRFTAQDEDIDRYTARDPNASLTIPIDTEPASINQKLLSLNCDVLSFIVAHSPKAEAQGES